tara:strand:- start:760 stop:1707 length:948 start_codon:yes stop_codon:yes gene_type:complete
MSSSRIPFTVRDKNTKINAIPGMNFDDIKINTLIKKVDENNAGNSNIDSEYTATGSVTSIINGDPDGALAVVGGKITTEVTGGVKKMTLSVGDDALERGIIITENGTVSIIYDLTVTNVNIDGVINLNGTPGVAGAVLTSNGAADPTWETAGLSVAPYYMKAGITANYTLTGTSGTDVLITGATEQFSGVNPYFGDWNATNDYWVCPNTAVYKINGSLRVAGSSGVDRIRKAFVKLAVVNAAGSVIRILNQGGFDMYVETESEGHNWTINCFAMEQITTGDNVALLIEWSVSTGGVIIQGSTSPDATFITVEKII